MRIDRHAEQPLGDEDDAAVDRVRRQRLALEPEPEPIAARGRPEARPHPVEIELQVRQQVPGQGMGQPLPVLGLVLGEPAGWRRLLVMLEVRADVDHGKVAHAGPARRLSSSTISVSR